jgi:hypothetical protein
VIETFSNTLSQSLLFYSASVLLDLTGTSVFKVLNLSVAKIMPDFISSSIFFSHIAVFGPNGILGKLLFNELLSNYLLDEEIYTPLREEFTDRFLLQELAMKRVPKYALQSLGYVSLVEWVDYPVAVVVRILSSSYVFSITHAQYLHDRDRINRTFFLGIALGIMQESAGTTFYPIVTHALYNSIVNAQLRLFGAPSEDDFDSIFEDF